MQSVRFLFDGQRLRENQTPQEVRDASSLCIWMLLVQI